MSVARTILLALACALALPSAASAGSVSINGGMLTFAAATGETNAVSVSRPDGGAFVIRDSGPPPTTSQPGCVASADSVTCEGAGVTAVSLSLGDLDDRATSADVGVTVTIFAGAGADVLELRNGVIDNASCGAGIDRATVDFGDEISGDCEAVERAPDPNAVPTPTPTPTATPAPAEPTPAEPTPTPSATPTPTPKRDRSAPSILVSKRSIRLDSKGRFRIVLISANEPAVGDVIADTAEGRRVRLGRAVFVLRWRARTKVRIKLRAAGRRSLRRARGRPLPMRVRISARDAAGNSVQITAKLKLKPAKRKR